MFVPESLGPVEISVTREQLVRYAAASGDFNPIHYDTLTAQSFGLPGVIIHGMLSMGLWDLLFVPFYQEGYRITQFHARFRQIVQPSQLILSGTVNSPGPAELRVTLAAHIKGESKAAVTGEAALVLTPRASHGTATGQGQP